MGKNGNAPVSQTVIVLTSGAGLPLSTVMKTLLVTDEPGRLSFGQSADSKSISEPAQSQKFSGSVT